MGDDSWQNSEELAFIPEQVEPVLTLVLSAVLANEVYDEVKVPLWVDLICEKSMEALAQQAKPFKYVVTCLIMQKNGAGIHAAQSCFWDAANDNVARVTYPLANKREVQDSRMYCIVTCFGIAM
ncbi:dynein light chain-like protein [Pelagophyceae sp. CCMP2097]|nr:dynein light chain-like protein [Pelagophyceae sp. CCMP2097]